MVRVMHRLLPLNDLHGINPNRRRALLNQFADQQHRNAQRPVGQARLHLIKQCWIGDVNGHLGP